MLRDDDRLLIAAALDGELSPTEAARVRTLLAESEQASDLLRQLTADRDRLVSLPKRKAPASVARIVARRIEPLIVPSTLVKSNRRPAWFPYALAASVFLSVGTGILVVSQSGRHAGARLEYPPVADTIVRTAPAPDLPSRETLPTPQLPIEPLSAVAVAKRGTPPPPVDVRIPGSPDLLTAPAVGDVPSLRAESARLPLLFSFAEAEQESVRDRLTTEFAASPAVRIDVFSRDLSKSLELLTVAARANGVAVSTLPLTSEQVRRKLPVTVAVYFDALTAKELTAVMIRWAKVDSPTNSLHRGHVLPAGAAESRELKALLGFDPGLGKRSTDESGKSIAAGTAEQVARQMGKGSPKPAVAMTFAPAAARVPPGASPDIKLYLEKRGDRPSNAVPTLILLKPAN
jgi:hypothetical protein